MRSMNDKLRRILFLINPASGGKEKLSLEAEIRKFLPEPVFHCLFYTLRKNENPAQLQNYISQLSPHTVVAAGGDGTVKFTAELLSGNESIGIIPLGSANGLATELGIPPNLPESLQIIKEGYWIKSDILTVNGSETCLHLSDLGINAMLIKQSDKSKGKGWLKYLLSAFSTLQNRHRMRATIKTERGSYSRKAYMIVLANASRYGTGAQINPKGNLEDGIFEIAIVKRLNLFRIFMMLINRKSFDSENIEIIRAKRVEITLKKAAHFQIDGEYRGRKKQVTAEIKPHALKILVPKKVS